MLRYKAKTDPDTSICTTRRVGAVIPVAGVEMFYCGIDNAECRYAMQLGWDYICKHPDNASFCAVEAPEGELIEPDRRDSFPADESLTQ